MASPELRQRLLDTVRLRGLSDRTGQVYSSALNSFVRHAQASPETLGTEAIRAWLLHLRREGYAAETLKSYRAAIAFLYIHVLHRPEVLHDVPKPRPPRRDVVPALTRHEVQRLLASAKDPLDDAFFRLLYGTGMRMGEACAVQVCHIDRANGLLHVPLAKGGKARSAARLRDAPARAGRVAAHDPTAARPRAAGDDDPLHRGVGRHPAPGPVPADPARAAPAVGARPHAVPRAPGDLETLRP